MAPEEVFWAGSCIGCLEKKKVDPFGICYNILLAYFDEHKVEGDSGSDSLHYIL